MRKKFIGVYALMAVLALGTTVTSCVDDNESASVTAIRDAKAKQLESLANLNNEKATAVKIKAEAEAAIANAQAEFQRIKNELKGLELEKAKATLAIEIEAAKADAEVKLIYNKAALEKAKAALIEAMDNLAEAQKTAATAIMTAMDGLLDEINRLNSEIITTTFEKTNAEFDLANLNIDKVQEENENNITIAKNEALIKEYEKYSQEGYEAARKAAEEARKEATVLEILNKDNIAKFTEAQGKENTIKTNLNQTLFVVSARSYFEQEEVERTEVTVKFDDGTVTTLYNMPEGKYIVDAEAKAGLEERIKNAETDVRAAGLGVAEAEKALADKKAGQEYKDAVAAVTAAEKKLADAKTEAEVQQARWELQNAKETLANVTAMEEQNLEDKQEAKERAEESLESLNNALAAVNDTKAYEEYSKMYDEYVAANKAAFDAVIEQTKSQHNYGVKDALATNLESVANQTTNYADLIDECNKAINTAKQNNDALQAVKEKEELIRYYDDKLKAMNSQLEINNKLYAQYETALNQVINGEMPEIPETPETPAE